MRDKLLPLVRDENQILTFIEDYCHYDGYFDDAHSDECESLATNLLVHHFV